MFQINWKLKAFLYKVFQSLRLTKSLYFIQKYITRRSKINIQKIDPHWERHESSIRKNNCISLLEIGAGKSLEQNIYFSYIFNNQLKQTVIDINKMIDFNLFNDASLIISNLLNLKFKGKVTNQEEILNKYNIQYLAPHKLSDLSKKKFDICVSTTTLEHFSLQDLNNFLLEVKKILKEGGLISSIIDYSDHYSHTDKNINSLNFLKFDESDWVKYNNSYLYQNRLRHQDYRKLFNDFNYEIKIEHKGNSAEKFQNISNKFDAHDDETFICWGYYLLAIN
tara:strand:+ start:470 stop:1309 length:840 start_codon:yes stop_codon:yes gene_type:complete